MRRALLPLLLSGLFAAALADGARAEEFAAVVNRIVYPGQTIAPEAVEEVPFKATGRLTGPVAQSLDEVTGKVARRTLLPGHLIPVSSLREPYLVEAGAPVLAMFVHDGLTITATAVSLEPGALGDMVRLRNPDSGKVVSGVVLADGTVRLGR